MSAANPWPVDGGPITEATDDFDVFAMVAAAYAPCRARLCLCPEHPAEVSA